MPAIVAHYQFGVLVANQLPPAIKTFLNAHQAFFTLGLQGPDLLFYHKPLSSNPISQLGHTIHNESGHHFFSSTLCTALGGDANQLAYLCGVCCHYGLDRACHPVINAFADGNIQSHQALESALDAHIIALHGMRRHRSYYLPPVDDYAPIARAYNLDTSPLRRCARSFRFYTHLLDHPKAVQVGEGILGIPGKFSSLCLPQAPENPGMMAQLYELFQRAIPRTVDLMESFYWATQYDTPCPKDFQETFSGTS